MRILLVSEHVPHPSMGGLAKHVLTLASALIKAGHHVDIIGNNEYPLGVVGDEGQFGGQFFAELYAHTVGWKESKLGLFLPPKRGWIAKKLAQRIMNYAADYDVVHYHGHYPNIAKYIPLNINFVQTRHDQGGDCVKNTRFRNGAMCNFLDPADCAGCITARPNGLQRLISKFAVRNYRRDVAEAFRRHKTIFVSDMLRRNFSRVAGNEDWGVVLHHFIDLDKLKAISNDKSIPADKGNQSIKLFFAGTLYPHKGIDSFLQKLVPVMPENMSLIIAGTSPIEAVFREQFESDRVIFLGWCDYPTVLQKAALCDAMIVPSIWEEPFGATTLEGLLLGKPTYALERGGTPELKVYERYPGQLRLHKDIDSLVNSLIGFKPNKITCFELDERGGVDQAIRHLLSIYQAPSHPI
ncbi:glycosyltransferase family 4 protein [Methylomonas sp. BW4-1]|uniref:glycosyltransferase family 4 protein n=1 Tax=Methylomonas sp. BW4-1 TaxID=3376685 RepID=UPI0040422502